MRRFAIVIGVALGLVAGAAVYAVHVVIELSGAGAHFGPAPH